MEYDITISLKESSNTIIYSEKSKLTEGEKIYFNMKTQESYSSVSSNNKISLKNYCNQFFEKYGDPNTLFRQKIPSGFPFKLQGETLVVNVNDNFIRTDENTTISQRFNTVLSRNSKLKDFNIETTESITTELPNDNESNIHSNTNIITTITSYNFYNQNK